MEEKVLFHYGNGPCCGIMKWRAISQKTILLS